ncbi:MAG: hypothetical protein AB6733_20675 [Clostridiaceae bacterium]
MGKSKKLVKPASYLQLLVGLITVLICTLYFMGKFGDNVGILVILSILCCLIGCVNLVINIKNK